MKLVATTFTSNAASIIRDAIKSVVSWVDVCLIIDTGVTDATLEIARRAAGDKYVARTFRWRNDFSAARNFALDTARKLGGDWAVTVDTDERLDLMGQNIRAVLASANEEMLMMSSKDGSYVKERFFRLPTRVRWSGPTHESFPSYKVKRRVLGKGFFHELPKSASALRRKFERDAAMLEAYTRKHPFNPRWHFYLGESYKYLGRDADAIAAYNACAALRGWDEESAWACYRAAECHVALGAFQEAIDRCAAGLARHAGTAELAWLAAFSAYHLGQHAQAVYWALLSSAVGCFRGVGATMPRIGFRNVNALYELPFEVLRVAYKALGNRAKAEEARRLYHEAIRARRKASRDGVVPGQVTSVLGGELVSTPSKRTPRSQRRPAR
jgi:tetratricopeptide (TPR) repeat protein